MPMCLSVCLFFQMMFTEKKSLTTYLLGFFLHALTYICRFVHVRMFALATSLRTRGIENLCVGSVVLYSITFKKE